MVDLQGGSPPECSHQWLPSRAVGEWPKYCDLCGAVLERCGCELCDPEATAPGQVEETEDEGWL